MNDSLINLAARMNNDFYVGVVGPCRSGKSSFINSFFKEMIIPNINDEYIKNKIIDELPQTAEGKQIMTVEPKFVPSNSFLINIDSININLRFVDCVGDIIESSEGYGTDKEPRMVKTPWFDEAIPFKEAANIGTEKVIHNHSNLGVYITSDGSFGEFTRTDYERIDDELIPKLIDLKKPFVILLNTKNPNDKKAIKLADELNMKWQTTVLCVNNTMLTKDDCNLILSKALEEFPISDLEISLPDYLEVLGDEFEFKKNIYDLIKATEDKYKKIKEINILCDTLRESNLFSEVKLNLIDSAKGKANIILDLDDEKYKEIIKSLLGEASLSKKDFISYLYKSNLNNKAMEGYRSALMESKKEGYGVSIPDINDIEIIDPVVVKKNGMYGVKLEAKTKVTHMVTVDLEASFTPIVGSQEEASMLASNLTLDKDKLWNMEFFGRKLSDILTDTMKSKLINVPDKSKDKIKEVLEKLTNSDRNNIIAIII